MIRKLKINEAKRYGKFDGLHHYIADQDWSKWSENDYKDVMFAIRDADRYQKTVDAGRGTSYTKQRADELWGEVERLIDKANKNADAERARYKKIANTKDRAKVESSLRESAGPFPEITQDYYDNVWVATNRVGEALRTLENGEYPEDAIPLLRDALSRLRKALPKY